MLRYSAGVNAVGFCRARYLDVRLLCPHGGDLPRRVRFVPERALDSVTRDVCVCPSGLHAPSLSSCIPCGPHTHTSTKSSPHLRLGSYHFVMIATPSALGATVTSWAVEPERMHAGIKWVHPLPARTTRCVVSAPEAAPCGPPARCRPRVRWRACPGCVSAGTGVAAEQREHLHDSLAH